MPVLQHCLCSEPLPTRCCRLSVLELFLGQSWKLCVNPEETPTPVWVAPKYGKLNSSPDPPLQPTSSSQNCNSVFISFSTWMSSQHHSFSSYHSAFLVFFLRISVPWNVAPVAVGSWVEGRRVSRVQGSHCFAWVNEAPHSVLEESSSVSCVVLLYGTPTSLTREKTVKILQPVNGPEESFLNTTLGRGKWSVDKIKTLLLDWLIFTAEQGLFMSLLQPWHLNYSEYVRKNRTPGFLHRFGVWPPASCLCLRVQIQDTGWAGLTALLLQNGVMLLLPVGYCTPALWTSSGYLYSISYPERERKGILFFKSTNVSRECLSQHKAKDRTALWGVWLEKWKAISSLPGCGKQTD